MAMTKEQLMEMEIDEIFKWDIEKLDAVLKELNVSGATSWNKAQKAHELIKAVDTMKTR